MLLKFARHLRTVHQSKNVRWISSRHDSGKSTKSISFGWSHILMEDEPEKAKVLPMENNSSFVTFEDFINQRRTSAKRSVMVQVKSRESSEDLIHYCQSNFGPLKGLHFFHNPENEAFDSFFIVELESKDSVHEILCNHARHRSDTRDNFPVFSPFLWLSNGNNQSKMPLSYYLTNKSVRDVPVFLPSDGQAIADEETLKAHLTKSHTIDDQMKALLEATKLTSLCEKVRFLACEQLESSIKGIFPSTAVFPFGSSVNSFGNSNCDLDMVLTHEDKSENKSSRLVFHTKGGGGVYARRTKDNTAIMSYMSYAIQNFLPGCKNVTNIFHARVPIVKFRQDFMDLDCDLSSQSSGYHMSGLLYLWGMTDPRVRPLVFTIRKWAKYHDLVGQQRPTTLFTNFPLTLMVIFFLQNKHQILPSVLTLHSLARPQDKIVTEDGLDCTYLRDINGFEEALNSSVVDKAKAELSLSELLLEFFEFYALFNYNEHAICVVSGKTKPKKKMTELEITNPLDPRLNVAANVRMDAVLKLRKCCSEACQKFDHLSKIQEDEDEIGVKLMYILKPCSIPPKNSESRTDQKVGRRSIRQLANKKKPLLPTSAELFDIR